MRHGAETISYCQIITLEKYSSGRRGAPAKGIGRVDRREGSNPSFSALGKMKMLRNKKKVVDKKQQI